MVKDFVPMPKDYDPTAVWGYHPDLEDDCTPKIETSEGVWGIDHSAGCPILVYNNCSVIQDEQAEYVMDLIKQSNRDWLPIGIAPMDGTVILLGYAGSHSEEGYWMGDPSKNYWGETGWYSVSDEPIAKHPSHPSHWMPMPTPPKR